MPLPATLPAPRTALDDHDKPVRHCPCGVAIGDGDYASGHRRCAFHRRPPRRWTTLPSPRR